MGDWISDSAVACLSTCTLFSTPSPTLDLNLRSVADARPLITLSEPLLISQLPLALKSTNRQPINFLLPTEHHHGSAIATILINTVSGHLVYESQKKKTEPFAAATTITGKPVFAPHPRMNGLRRKT